jgi:hypothetical protein
MVLVPLTAIADRLHYGGTDRERSVRLLFLKHGVPFIRRGRGVYFATERQYEALDDPCRARNALRQRAFYRLSYARGRGNVSGAR